MKTNEMLQLISEFVFKCNETNSSNDKMEVIREYMKHDCIKSILYYTTNPFYNFYITSDNLKKNEGVLDSVECPDSLFDILDLLRLRNVTGHKAIALYNSFIAENIEYKELLYTIIDRNLKCRTDAKLINKVIPEFIPQFEVALANSYEDVQNKVDFKTQNWYASRKLDGCRCITVIDNDGDILFFSREGKPFETLNTLGKEIEKLGLKNMVIDGEVCMYDPKTLKEDFQGIMKEIKRKDHTIDNVKYFVFDMLSLDDFNKGASFLKLQARHAEMRKVIKDDYRITVLPQTKVESKEHLELMIKSASANKWEGLILRKDAEYKGKRSNDLLKCKKFFDAEYKVKSIEVGDMRVINKESGLEETITTLSKVVIEHKGYDVGVGSGFSLDERKHYYKNPTDIIGKVITVQYFEETKNQSGGISLRFPTVKCIHGDKRTT